MSKWGSMGKQGTKTHEVVPYVYHRDVVESVHHTYYLSDFIIEPQYYTEMIQTIRQMRDTDHVYLYLNTGGGNLNTGVQLINACRDSAGTIHTILDGEASSLGAILLLVGHTITINDNTLLMFHDYSSVTGGKGSEQRSRVLAETQWYNQFMMDVCYPFLSKEEVLKVIQGQDLWFDAAEARERVLQMRAFNQELAAKSLADALPIMEEVDLLREPAMT